MMPDLTMEIHRLLESLTKPAREISRVIEEKLSALSNGQEE